jgi:hypothetical protein
MILHLTNESNQAKPNFCVGPILIPLVCTIKRFWLWLCTNVRGDAKKNRTEPKPFYFHFERTVARKV